MSTNYIAPIWRMPRNTNNTPVDKLSNYSIKFGSTNQVINFDSYTLPDKYTISIWLNPDASYGTDYGYYIGGTSGGTGFAIGQGGNAYGMQIGELYFFFGGSTSTLSGVVLPQNQWSHVLLVVDKTFGSQGKIETYLNNNLESTTTSFSSTPVSSFTSISIIGANTSTASQWDFSGEISQCCIFDYNLNVDQRNYIYNLNNPMAITGAEPVAYWPLGDNSNPNANAGYPNVSTRTDSVFLFSGSQFINVPDSDSLSFGDSVNDSPFSMSAWIKTSSSASRGIISKWGTTGTSGYEWIFWTVGAPAKLRLNLNDGTNLVYRYRQGSTNVDTGEWVHAVVTYDGRGGNDANDGIKIYVNGQEESSYTNGSAGTYEAMHNTARQVQIGAYNSVGQFNGEISNAEIWDVVLQPSEILELYNNGQPLMTGTQPQETNLQAWWKLNQSANWEADTTGNWQIPDNRSAYPQSFDFDGSTDYIAVPNSSNFDFTTEQEITVSAWVKYGGGSLNSIASLWVGGANKMWVLYPDKVTIVLGGSNVSTSSASVSANEWHHIAFTFSQADGELKHYVDKVATTVSNSNSLGYASGIPNLTIGNLAGSSQWMDGQISNLQIWNTALPATGTDSIETLYNNGVPLTTAIATDNLKLWSKLDNTATFSTNWSIPDASGNGNTGTSSGMTEQNLVNNNVSVLNGESDGMTTTALVQSNLTRTQPFSNYSMFYDAVDVYSTFDTQISIAASDSFTWSFWIKPVYNSISDMVLLRASSTSITANNTMLLTYSGGNWRIKWDNASGNFTTGYVMPNNEWSHVALSITQGTGTRYAYINGVQDSANAAVAGITSQWLGFSSQNTTNDFEGYLSQCAYWDTNLSTTELAALYNNGVPQDLRQFSVQPTQYWPMNQDYSYWDGSVWINRDIISGNDSTTVNTAVINAFVGNAPGSDASGSGNNLAIGDLRNNMKDSTLNAHSINMGDYADSVTNPANSGRSTDVP